MFAKQNIFSRPSASDKPSADKEPARIAITEDGRIVYASTAFSELSGTKKETLSGRTASTIINFSETSQTSPDFKTIEPGLHKIFIKGHANSFDFHFDWLTTPDNKRFLIGSQTSENKKPSKTQMKNFIRRLKEIETAPEISAALSPQETENFLNLSHEVMLIVTDLGEITKANQTFCDLTGYNLKDLHAIPFIELFDEQDRPYIRSTMQAFNPAGYEFALGAAQNFEARIVTKDRQCLWMEWRQQFENGTLYCTGRDITAIKQQEKALLRREKQLLQAESIGHMGHWNWVIGEETMDWSDEIYRIFGVERTGFSPTLEHMDDMVHREDIARVNQAFQRAIIEENDYDMEFRINRPDDTIRFVRCEGRCAFDDKGEVIALYGIMQDMTERTLYERDLRKAKEQAEAAYASRTQFLANMSHELRTPLNAIIGFSEMIERQLLGPIGTEKYLEYISGIRESGQHLLDLISDILDMSKIEAGKYELTLEEISIAKIIQLCGHMMEGRAHESGVKITLDHTLDEDFKIIADRRAILQILLNLLSNAVKFTPEGGEITLTGLQRENYLSLKIADNGIGIPANKLASVTKPFEQVSSSYARNHEGSGLGLAISKELAEMHGGTLFIESAVGQGTTVTVRIPFDASKTLKNSA